MMEVLGQVLYLKNKKDGKVKDQNKSNTADWRKVKGSVVCCSLNGLYECYERRKIQAYLLRKLI